MKNIQITKLVTVSRHVTGHGESSLGVMLLLNDFGNVDIPGLKEGDQLEVAIRQRGWTLKFSDEDVRKMIAEFRHMAVSAEVHKHPAVARLLKQAAEALSERIAYFASCPCCEAFVD